MVPPCGLRGLYRRCWGDTGAGLGLDAEGMPESFAPPASLPVRALERRLGSVVAEPVGWPRWGQEPFGLKLWGGWGWGEQLERCSRVSRGWHASHPWASSSPKHLGGSPHPEPDILRVSEFKRWGGTRKRAGEGKPTRVAGRGQVLCHFWSPARILWHWLLSKLWH